MILPIGLDSSDRFLQGVTAKISWLTQFPSIGRRRDDLATGIRNLNYEKYLIFYRVNDEAVDILRVVQGSRNLEQIFQPGDFGVCKVVCVKSLFLTLGTSLQIQLRSDLMRPSNYE